MEYVLKQSKRTAIESNGVFAVLAWHTGAKMGGRPKNGHPKIPAWAEHTYAGDRQQWATVGSGDRLPECRRVASKHATTGYFAKSANIYFAPRY
jgi:hypothetical protein